MKNISFTPGQLVALDKLIQDKGKDHRHLQHLLASGHLADLMSIVTDMGILMDRKKFRLALGLEQPKQLDLRPWKTIWLKVYKTKKELATALRQKRDEHVSIHTNVFQALHTPQFKLVEKELEVRLIKVTNEDLGLHDGAAPETTIRTGLMQGLALCPLQTGPQLCVDNVDLEMGDKDSTAVIASEEMTSGGSRVGNFVARYDAGYPTLNKKGNLGLWGATIREHYGKAQTFLFAI